MATPAAAVPPGHLQPPTFFSPARASFITFWRIVGAYLFARQGARLPLSRARARDGGGRAAHEKDRVAVVDAGAVELIAQVLAHDRRKQV